MKKNNFITQVLNVISWIIVALIVAGFFFLVFVRPQIEQSQLKRGMKKIEAREQSRKEMIRQFGDRYRASADWQVNLIYTIQAQDRLITGKPILFEGYVDDVFNRNGKTYARFLSLDSDTLEQQFMLELECDEQVLKKIMSHKPQKPWKRSLYPFAVVANINEVIRPAFALKAAPGAPAAPTVDDLEIIIDKWETPLIARGSCRDVLSLDANKFAE